ncbi:MAG: glutamate racemase [Elusimicrobiales bacterium]
MRNDNPIGIFDSGLGGLTVLKAVRRALPRENLIYFGDTAHVPYGSKSAQTVTGYSLEIARFLCARKIKLLIVACNTASALALNALKKAVPIPVIGVIEPGAKRALSVSRSKRIAVIGTEATVRSGAYRRAILKLDKTATVTELACPLFVPLVEEGWWQNRITQLTAEEYLNRLKPRRPDAVILGCTHYPVIKEAIAKAAGRGATLVDSAQAVAEEAAALLARARMARAAGKASVKIYASDDPARFSRLAANILGAPAGKTLLKTFR